MASLPLLAVVLCLVFAAASAITDPSDAAALGALYSTLNSPWQLAGWSAEGDDPCSGGGERGPWRGVSCNGSSVISINISGLGVGGWLGSQLPNFHSLKELDVSFNNITGEIPPTLPPNLEYINLAANQFENNIPLSLPWLHSLKYLNLSYNKLSGIIGDVFVNLESLETLDLSFNFFSGDLPRSFNSLKNLHSLYLQHNEFTGSVILLADLPLSVLNIENNHFSGYVPKHFEFVPDLRIDGNQFQPGFKHAPPSFNVSTPTPSPPPPSAKQNFSHKPKIPQASLGYSSVHDHNHHRKTHFRAVVAAIVVVCIVFVLFIVAFVAKSWRSHGSNRKSSTSNMQSLPVKMPRAPIVNQDRYSWSSPMIDSETCSSHRMKHERVSRRKSWAKTSKNLLTAKLFPAADILSATRDFSEECLIGEGFIGRVYKAEFPDGQILATKKINMVDLSMPEEDEFLDVLSTMSRLKHPNISALLGYSVEFGHYVLVYEYAENGSLDDILFSSAPRCRALSWKARMKIALGVAYALEYMHWICSPPVAHGNIKATNILLDGELMPYLSDCGLIELSHLISTMQKDSEMLTGAKGYAAPELISAGADKIKADIYSFGVILLELLTGQKAFDSLRRHNEQFLVNWASSRLHDLDSLERITDSRIRGSMPSKAVSALADIILLCIRQSPEFRPPMTEITDKLVQLVQSTGHHKTNAAQPGEVDAHDLSFRTTRAYFEPSSTGTTPLCRFLSCLLFFRGIQLLDSDQPVREQLRAAALDAEEAPLFPRMQEIIRSYVTLCTQGYSKYQEHRNALFRSFVDVNW